MKIRPVAPFSILSLKWAWRAQFLSHTPATLNSYLFFKDVQMILLSFVDNLNQKYIGFQSYMDVTLKLSLPCPFQTQNGKGRGRPNSQATPSKF